ncbi:MAG: hypothetical protein BWY29_01025 [Microgenomates group bacterium ADurb.Bin238]|nr:MAG: hypothetical protein BWY29_01025 [Microgenomates group bacterium ADurb.Bin238]
MRPLPFLTAYLGITRISSFPGRILAIGGLTVLAIITNILFTIARQEQVVLLPVFQKLIGASPLLTTTQQLVSLRVPLPALLTGNPPTIGR